MNSHVLTLRWTPLLGLMALVFGSSLSCADQPLRFNRDIRPILSEKCFACHGPDSAARKADLRLDQREIAIDMDAIAPGDPETSELVFRIEETDPTIMMPPPKSDKVLTAQEKATLRRWIAEGAEYEPHWSLIAPQKPEPPQVSDESWVKNPIDRFVLAKLEKAGLKPAPEADRHTLVRRLSLDLTGLPPDPKLVDEFIKDDQPGAYERLVDRLLASPEWGEHRAHYWLDASRYADTHGIHFDNFRETWAYRDWVINAYNKNMPFDQFTVEQLAGDLLPAPTLDQLVASGFNRNHITTNEGGTIPEEYLVLYTRDRTETASQVWMGLTVGCAVCHDHKFDPLSQREFYQMSAYFNNTTQGAMDGNRKDTPPTVFVPADDDRERWETLETELADARKKVEERRKAARPEFDRWLNSANPETLASAVPTEGIQLQLALDDRDKPATETTDRSLPEDPQAGHFERENGFSYGAWVRLKKANGSGAIVSRMDSPDNKYTGWDLWVQNGQVGTHIIHKWPEDALKVVSNDKLKPGEWHHVLVTYDGSSKAGGVSIYIDGQRKSANVEKDTLKSSIKTSDVPLNIGQRSAGDKLEGAGISDLRLYNRTLSEKEASDLAGGTLASWLASHAADKRPENDVNTAFSWWLDKLDTPYRDLKTRLAALEQEDGALKARGTYAYVMNERKEMPKAFILFRGDYDKRRDEVEAATPKMLPPMPDDYPKNRLGFARWLLRPEHPLTARVTVNRCWQELFGQGIVRTAGDFGVTGEPPSHPELLDWLAVEFRESGWDMKRFYKLMVMSSTYRQSAQATPEKLEKDRDNSLLSRGPRFRMDAEMVRDYALKASGLLVEKQGGPAVHPYQPTGVWAAVAMPESNTKLYKPDNGEGLYRRSLYTFWKRAAPPASMDIFNAPSREVCTVQRERTNTPLQALVTLNDPQFVEAARHLAELAVKNAGSDQARLDVVVKHLVSRSFRPEEAAVVLKSLDELKAYYAEHPDDAQALIAVGLSKPNPSLDAKELASWTMLTNELMNLDEVLNK